MAEGLSESPGFISESEKRFMEQSWHLSHQELYRMLVKERQEKSRLLDELRMLRQERDERE